jgi:hypothetical protein
VCETDYKMSELASDMVGARTELCRGCRRPLVDSIRAHVASCVVLRVQTAGLLERAKETREHSEIVRKSSQQACDRAEILRAEAESVVDEAERARRRQRPGESQC